MSFMHILGAVLVGIQVIVGILLILIIAIQTTKSEEGGAGLGWGTIGGQAHSSVHKFGLDAQLTRVTTWIAASFFALSLLSAVVYAHAK